MLKPMLKRKYNRNKVKNEAVEGVTDVVKDAQKKVEEAEAKKAATEVKVPEVQVPRYSTQNRTATNTYRCCRCRWRKKEKTINT